MDARTSALSSSFLEVLYCTYFRSYLIPIRINTTTNVKYIEFKDHTVVVRNVPTLDLT
jgi:hypothetical protein